MTTMTGDYTVVVGLLVVALSIVGFFLLNGSGSEGKGKSSSAIGSPQLDPKTWIKLKLTHKDVISSNTAVYTFALPNPRLPLGLPIGQHIQIKAEIDGREVTRSYTPVSSNDDIGICKLLIKTYPNGNVSKYVGNLKIGDFIEIRGPKGTFVYKPNMVKDFGMIAGGTGITPMYQIIEAIVKNPEDKTNVHLLYGSLTESDILLRTELDDIAAAHPQIKVHYVLNDAPAGWKGGVGFITKDMIDTKSCKPGPTSKMLLCGPPPMVSAMVSHCMELGFPKPQAISKPDDMVFKF